MKLLILAAAMAATTPAVGPTAAQFNAALAAACPDHRAETRNVSCEQTEIGSVQYTCHYEMRAGGGAWAAHDAVVQQAEGEWVWIDGPTLCDDEDVGPN